ncbi:putative phloem protein [Helianthus anomalus]
MLSPFTEYTCYLVFKVSEKCPGLHCPVKVRDLLHRRKKENKIIYFRSPAALNHHDVFWVPQQRKDGWMEVMIWKFKPDYNKQVVPMNLKLVTYEGTMSGLIICGLEFRPDQS